MVAEPQDTDEPYVFISYAREDESYVTELVACMAEHNIAGWVDVEIDHGEDWSRVIRDRIDGCAAFVVVMTPSSEGSDWVKREVRRAQDQDKLILPLLLDGTAFFEVNIEQFENVSDRQMPSPRFVQRMAHLTSVAPPARQDDPAVAAGGPATAEQWLDEGNRLFELGEYEDSVSAYDHAIELDRLNATGHFGRGRALARLGSQLEAVAATERAVELDPDHAFAHYHRGATLASLGRDNEALAAYDRAIELDPDHAFAHYNRGVLLASLGRDEEALVAYGRAIELDPDHPFADYNRGVVLARLGR